mmetsp:Transcript_23078/g.46708  ORF Transcript_23078/g.46708 Transcript_23078/m.46708 type:complete len:486 (-) Transcript_23078:294-1751(-)
MLPPAIHRAHPHDASVRWLQAPARYHDQRRHARADGGAAGGAQQLRDGARPAAHRQAKQSPRPPRQRGTVRDQQGRGGGDQAARAWRRAHSPSSERAREEVAGGGEEVGVLLSRHKRHHLPRPPCRPRRLPHPPARPQLGVRAAHARRGSGRHLQARPRGRQKRHGQRGIQPAGADAQGIRQLQGRRRRRPCHRDVSLPGEHQLPGVRHRPVRGGARGDGRDGQGVCKPQVCRRHQARVQEPHPPRVHDARLPAALPPRRQGRLHGAGPPGVLLAGEEQHRGRCSQGAKQPASRVCGNGRAGCHPVERRDAADGRGGGGAGRGCVGDICRRASPVRAADHPAPLVRDVARGREEAPSGGRAQRLCPLVPRPRGRHLLPRQGDSGRGAGDPGRPRSQGGGERPAGAERGVGDGPDGGRRGGSGRDAADAWVQGGEGGGQGVRVHGGGHAHGGRERVTARPQRRHRHCTPLQASLGLLQALMASASA